MSRHPVLLGKLGEISIIKKFIEHNIPVYAPIVDLYGADLIVILDGEIKKVQIKSTETYNNDNTSRTFSLLNHCISIHNNIVKSNSYKYDTNTVDYFALYDAINDKIFLVKNSNNLPSTIVITDKTKNGQVKNIRFSKIYDIDNQLNKRKIEKRNGYFVIRQSKYTKMIH